MIHPLRLRARIGLAVLRARAFLRLHQRFAVALLAVGVLATIGLGGGVLGGRPARPTPTPPTPATPTPSATSAPAGQRRGPFRVLHVSDGATLLVEEQPGGSTTVRLVGIDAPALADQGLQTDCLAAAATRALASMVGGRTITLEVDPDQGIGQLSDSQLSDRQLGDGSPGDEEVATQLAYVYTGRTLVNRTLLEGGFVTEYAARPYRLQNQFRAAEQSARQKGLGVWSPGRCAAGTG